VQTSENIAGQVYLPFVNWSLMIGSIAVTVAFQTTAKIGNAFGEAILLAGEKSHCRRGGRKNVKPVLDRSAASLAHLYSSSLDSPIAFDGAFQRNNDSD